MANEKILIIDDNQMNLELATDLLELSGYHVLQAEDAASGIALAKAEKPNLILMDIHLPGMDGLTAVRILKEDTKLLNIPIVALTAYAMKGDEEKALATGCIGYISKPINTREFPRQVASFLNLNAERRIRM